MEAIFTTNHVTLYLSRNYPYAATCFANDMVEHGDTVSSLIVQKWFRRYFTTQYAYNVYRELEVNVTQTIL